MEGKYEEENLPSAAWGNGNIYKEEYGTKKGVSSEGRKRGYQGFFSF